jgi:hypothetical protein
MSSICYYEGCIIALTYNHRMYIPVDAPLSTKLPMGIRQNDSLFYVDDIVIDRRSM